VRLDRRVDPQPARPDPLDAVRPDELVADVAEEVGLTDLLVQPAGLEADATPAREAVLAGGDHPLVAHRREHLVAARGGTRGVGERVVHGRRLGQACQERRLGERQCAGGAGEVGPRRRLGAVGEVPVEDRVQVLREDPLLGLLALELHGEAGLGDLPLDGPLVGDVEVADELLSDRGAALDDTPGLHVAPERPRDALGVDAVVRVEPPVLDRNSRAHQPGEIWPNGTT
jgi:hypothetical protein